MKTKYVALLVVVGCAALVAVSLKRKPDPDYVEKAKRAAWAAEARRTVPIGPQPLYSDMHPIETAITNTVLVLLGVGIGLVIYFAPGITASRRKHRQAGAIWTLNFALGWTLIGWVVALVWANMVPEPPPNVIVQQPWQAPPDLEVPKSPKIQ